MQGGMLAGQSDLLEEGEVATVPRESRHLRSSHGAALVASVDPGAAHERRQVNELGAYGRACAQMRLDTVEHARPLPP